MAEVQQQCPCKQQISEGEKGILNVGLSTDMLKNPSQAAIDIASQLGGNNATRIKDLIGQAQAGGITGALMNGALPSLQQAQNKLTSLVGDGTANNPGVLKAFQNECNRLTDPKQLLNIVSSLSLYGELGCALGIPGLDIGAGLSVVNENGQLSVQYAVAANVDIEKVLNKFSDGAGTNLAQAVQDLNSGISSAFAALDQANAAIQGVVDATTAMQNEAAAFIQKYTDISGLANLLQFSGDDPCFKLGSTLQGSLVSPDFLNAVRGGSSTGFGGNR